MNENKNQSPKGKPVEALILINDSLNKQKKKRLPRKIKKAEPLTRWIKKFNKVGKRYGYNVGPGPLDFDDWIDYYDDGYTPLEAIKEDMSYAF